MSPRCKERKSNGLVCKNNAVDSSGYCAAHMSKKRKTDDESDILEDLRDRISALELKVKDMMKDSDCKGVKKERNVTSAGIRRKAMFIYYKQMKMDDTFMSNLIERLKASGLHVTKMVGNEEKDDIPWTLIKQFTDKSFELLTDEEKTEWFKKAMPNEK